MHVPAYWPAVVGAQALEKRGVLWSVVKTIDMLVMLEEDDNIPDISILAVGRRFAVQLMPERDHVKLMVYRNLEACTWRAVMSMYCGKVQEVNVATGW